LRRAGGAVAGRGEVGERFTPGGPAVSGARLAWRAAAMAAETVGPTVGRPGIGPGLRVTGGRAGGVEGAAVSGGGAPPARSRGAFVRASRASLAALPARFLLAAPARWVRVAELSFAAAAPGDPAIGAAGAVLAVASIGPGVLWLSRMAPRNPLAAC